MFKLKQSASTSVNATTGTFGWNYDTVELIADGVVHAIGVSSGLVGATALVVLTAVYASAVDIVVVSIYVAGLLSMLVLSATYNLWPVSPTKWKLRRFDHSAIYLLIAATYTPFIAELPNHLFAAALLVGVWGVAIFGIVLKLRWPGRFDTVAICLYLALGWSGMMMYDSVIATMPKAVLICVLAGGILYSFGVIFHSWRRLRFQNVIWHCFVLLGAAFHYTAVLDLVLA